MWTLEEKIPSFPVHYVTCADSLDVIVTLPAVKYALRALIFGVRFHQRTLASRAYVSPIYPRLHTERGNITARQVTQISTRYRLQYNA